MLVVQEMVYPVMVALVARATSSRVSTSTGLAEVRLARMMVMPVEMVVNFILRIGR